MECACGGIRIFDGGGNPTLLADFVEGLCYTHCPPSTPVAIQVAITALESYPSCVLQHLAHLLLLDEVVVGHQRRSNFKCFSETSGFTPSWPC